MNENEKEARSTYRRVRGITCRALGIAPGAFDREARDLAREFADGEEVSPRHWIMGAKQHAWNVLGDARYAALIGR